MSGITEEIIRSSLSYVRGNVRELYYSYKHYVPSKESFFSYISYVDLEKLYRKKVAEIEEDYKYLQHKNIDKYKPTKLKMSLNKSVGKYLPIGCCEH